MNDGIEVVERRKHERFHVDDGTLPVCGRPSVKVGQVIDIGMGWAGISLHG
jgi:hypothetical protein